ncbi:hypothetical protein, partial [Streptococcus suis]
MSDYQVTGMEQILHALESRLGEANMRRVMSKALRTIAKEHVAPEVEAMARSFVDKGNTVRQIVVGNVSFADYNIPKIKVGWK